ncbi:AAA family ATPase [Streptomyces sp. NPDC001156]
MVFTDPARVSSADLLVGRERDLDRILGVLEQHAGGALLLSGDPGVGKSAVLDTVAGAAAQSGAHVLRAAGTEFEAGVRYSALNQILLPLHSALDRLSASSGEALSAALGFGAGPSPERLVVCNAALALLRSAAEDSPLLLIVDDLPWVDRASAAVFGFLARRLSGGRIRFLAASRTGVDSFFDGSGLPAYELPALDADSAARLVDLRFPDLAHPVRRRLLDAAQGNPLALLELPDALRADQRRAREVVPAVLPLGKRLQSLLVSRVRSLPAATRFLLLLATLEGTGDPLQRRQGVRHHPRPPRFGDRRIRRAPVDEAPGQLLSHRGLPGVLGRRENDVRARQPYRRPFRPHHPDAHAVVRAGRGDRPDHRSAADQRQGLKRAFAGRSAGPAPLPTSQT